MNEFAYKKFEAIVWCDLMLLLGWKKVCQFNDRAFVFVVAALAAGFTTF